MTREPNTDQIVTRWVDEGPEVAPERFVWAALDQVERTPQRGRGRVTLENTPMLLKFAVPVLGAAAAIVLGIVIYGNLNPAPAGAPSDTPVPSPSAVVSADPTPDPCSRDVVEVPGPGTLDVMWCVPRGTDRVVLPFTIQAPEALVDQEAYTGGEVLYLRPEGEPAILFALTGPDAVDDWVAEIAGTDAFEISDAEAMEIAGGEAAVIDVRLAEGTNPDEAPPLIDSSDLPWRLKEGDTARVWILEGQGEAVAVATSTTDADFDAWAEQVGQAVESLEWGTAP